MAKYALVIGIDHYEHFSNLKSAAKDAEAVAQLLESQNYRVTRLPRKLVDENQWVIAPDKSLSYGTLKAEVLDFFEKRADQQDAVLYFAGHGFRVLDDFTEAEQGFLAPSDAKRGKENAIAFDSLNTLMARANLSRWVVLLDCCYAGSAGTFPCLRD